MAKGSYPLSSHDQHIFSSVFPPSSIGPPKRQSQRRDNTKHNVEALKSILYEESRLTLGVGDEEFNVEISTSADLFYCFFPNCSPLTTGVGSSVDQPSAHVQNLTNLRVRGHLQSWRQVFGVVLVEKTFAVVIDKLVTEFVTWSYASSHEASAIPHLRFWVRNLLLPYVSAFCGRLHGDSGNFTGDIVKWEDIALTRLADLRISELFDIVVNWENTTAAIDDLKQYATNPATRSYLTTEFAAVLSRRLLHPGASTIDILLIYISIIRVFRRLDPRGVLLERVARKIRRYLRDRDDTIRVVVAGLLSDVSEHANADQQDPNTLSELAVELQTREHGKAKLGDGELDWNNMAWMPDPIDAAPEYMKSKSTDVIGSLISLFDSKDVFVKELQTMLADRLLMNKPDFDQEIGVIEHLKIRFGDAALQGCEVMLRDVLDSTKVDHVIRQDQQMDREVGAAATTDIQLHAKILSRLFWPSLQEQTFDVPSVVQEQQSIYEKGFESLKQSRKLTWLNAIGQVEVELELEDRTFSEEVLPWQASVIYAFQEPANDHTTVTKTVSALSEELSMTLTLVRSACMFWSSRRILHESSRDTFIVLETLPTDSDGIGSTAAPNQTTTSQPNVAAAAAAAEAAAIQAAREAEEADRKAKMAMYHQFVVSMLTNQGSMPLPRIAMMLGIVVPGGFPFGNEELREFLGAMVKDGVLEIGAGGAYKVSS